MALPPSSPHYSILNDISAALALLQLTDWNGAVVPVDVRKLPQYREKINVLPVQMVCPSEEIEVVKPWSGPITTMSRPVNVQYLTDVVTAGPRNEDSKAYLPWYLNWRMQTRRAVQEVLFKDLPEVWRVFVEETAAYDSRFAESNFDWMVLRVSAWNREPAQG